MRRWQTVSWNIEALALPAIAAGKAHWSGAGYAIGTNVKTADAPVRGQDAEWSKSPTHSSYRCRHRVLHHQVLRLHSPPPANIYEASGAGSDQQSFPDVAPGLLFHLTEI